jgi:hypothetical protein
MSIFDNLHLAVRTRNIDAAGTSSGFNLTVNVDATDVLDQNFSVDLEKGEATLLGGPFPETLDSTLLTNTSIRLGIRGDDAWAPHDVLVFGLAFQRNELAALAMETDLSDADLLSMDDHEGKLTMPIRLVGRGGSSTLIRRVLLLVDTIWQHFTDTETDSPIELEISVGGNLVLLQEIVDTPQPDLEAGKTNWYPLDAAVPFTRGDVLANGDITLRIKGQDAWKPMRLFLFGLDTATGRPNEVVSLVSLPNWPHGWMSADTDEGKPSVELDVVSI